MDKTLMYYAQPGPLTSFHTHLDLLARLPREVPALIQAVQGLAVHIFWAKAYGLELSKERQAEVGLRPAASKLERILALDPAPLDQPRPPERRLVCNCRDFSTLLVAILRSQGTPARARCGFGTYFTLDHFEDHWVIEYWSPEQARWVMADGQLDAVMIAALKPNFDPLDMPPGQFVPGGEAWRMVHEQGTDPDKFGIFEYHGLDFVRGNVIRDFASLNKMEVLPWDFWGILNRSFADSDPAAQALVDQISRLTAAPDANFTELRRLYSTTPALQPPDSWVI